MAIFAGLDLIVDLAADGSVASVPSGRQIEAEASRTKLKTRKTVFGHRLHFKDHDHECRATLDSVVTSVKCITGAF